MATLSLTIVAEADDGRYAPPSTLQAQAGIAGIIGNPNVTYGTFNRFTDVTVPQGATISSAVLTYKVIGSAGSGPVLMKTTVADLDNAVAPSTYSGAVGTARTTASTTSSVSFPPATTIAVDVTSSVAEVVARSGWASGNALLLFSDDNGSASGTDIAVDSFSGSTPASLSITYTDTGSVSSGSASGSVAWTGAPSGSASFSGDAAGAVLWAGSVSGRMTFTVTATVDGEDVVLAWNDQSATYAVELDGTIIAWNVGALTYTDTPGDGEHTYRVGVLG